MTIQSHLKFSLMLLVLGLFCIGNSLQAQDSLPTFVDWNPNGLYIVVGYGDEVRLIEVSTGQTIRTFPWSVVPSIQVSPKWSSDGNQLAIVNGNIEIWEQPWDLENTSATFIIPIMSTSNAMSWSPASKRIASADGQVISIWYIENQVEERFFYDQGLDQILDIEWASENMLLVSSTLNLIVLFDPNTGMVNNYYNSTSQLPVPGTETIDADPSGTKLVMGNDIGNISIWTDFSLTDSLEKSETSIRTNMNDFVFDTEWNPIYDVIAIFTGDSVHIWDFEANEIIETVEIPSFVRSGSWSPDGTQLAYGGAEGKLEIIDLPSEIIGDKD